VKMTTQLHLMLKNDRAINPLPHIYSWQSVQLIKHREKLTLCIWKMLTSEVTLTKRFLRLKGLCVCVSGFEGPAMSVNPCAWIKGPIIFPGKIKYNFIHA
jgi:hypothetical protein